MEDRTLPKVDRSAFIEKLKERLWEAKHMVVPAVYRPAFNY
jgi:hypothetical protein